MEPNTQGIVTEARKVRLFEGGAGEVLQWVGLIWLGANLVKGLIVLGCFGMFLVREWTKPEVDRNRFITDAICFTPDFSKLQPVAIKDLAIDWTALSAEAESNPTKLIEAARNGDRNAAWALSVNATVNMDSTDELEIPAALMKRFRIDETTANRIVSTIMGIPPEEPISAHSMHVLMRPISELPVSGVEPL